MQARHSVEGLFDDLESQNLNFLAIFAFFGKQPLMVKFSKFCSESFSRLKCRKICPTEIGEIVRYSRDQKISAASQTVATARIASKMCQSPQHLAHTVPDFILIE